MLEGLKNIFKGDPLKEFELTVRAINGAEADVQKLSDEELTIKSLLIREKLRAGEPLEDHLIDAFVFVREAARRTLGQRPFDEQILGGLVLHKGAVAEMVTGEGKTLAAVAPAYLNALSGNGVHVVTVNEYLARRDAVSMGQIYHALGLSVACLVPNAAFIYDPEAVAPDAAALIDKERDTTGTFLVQQEFLRPISRREAYLADITYGTNHEFGFDYLRDNLAYSFEQQVQREHHFAIIDEVDSILIDEARTPLIIAAPDVESSEQYKVFARIAAKLDKDTDYDVDEKKRTVSITEDGITKVEQMVGVQNMYAPEHLRLVHYLEESLRAKALFMRDKDYVVKNGEVIIVDEFTGRLLAGRRYSGGLHQAIEAKENVLVKEESKTYAKISIQNYFRMYTKISGMTGTAQTSAEEFHKVYNLDVISIPTHRPLVRKDENDLIYKNIEAKWAAVVKDIKERYDRGQPVLVGTTSIEKNERISALLSQAGVKHEMLNAKNNEREGAIIAQTGRMKGVTVATNMAGRGVDIILGGNPPSTEEARKVIELGGLHVVGTERHDARRIDNQLRGRAGRQGDPGSSQFFLSLEDDLVRIFGGDRIKGMMDRFDMPDDIPIDVGFVSKAVAQAQSKVEGANFDMRKHLLEYDDVLNKQRSAVYKRRQEILTALNKEELQKLITGAAIGHFEAAAGFVDGALQNDEFPAEELAKQFAEAGITTKNDVLPDHPTEDDFRTLLEKRSADAANDPVSSNRLLSILDMLWMTHLENLEALSESVGLRAYGQHDPLVEYRGEAHRLYRDFWVNYNGWIFTNLFRLVSSNVKVQSSNGALRSTPQQNPSGKSLVASGSKVGLPAIAPQGAKVGRNDPCPCGAKNPDGSPKKYKNCHGK